MLKCFFLYVWSFLFFHFIDDGAHTFTSLCKREFTQTYMYLVFSIYMYACMHVCVCKKENEKDRGEMRDPINYLQQAYNF